MVEQKRRQRATAGFRSLIVAYRCPRSFASIEKIGSDLTGLMQNGPDQDEIRLLDVKHRMGLKVEATKAWHDLVGRSSDTRKVGK
jgi:hypothetical protein